MIIHIDGLYRSLEFAYDQDTSCIKMSIVEERKADQSVLIPTIEWARLMDAGPALLLMSGKEEASGKQDV